MEEREGSFSMATDHADQHLEAARSALADGYRHDTNPMKTAWGRVGDARRHLNEIDPESPQHIAARDLMREVLFRERQIRTMCMNAANDLMVRQREMLAIELEHHYVSRGIPVDIDLSGPDKTSMRLFCPLLCDASVERIAHDSNLFVYLKEAGFKVVVLGDGDEYTWTYNIGKL
jgi:hypothetical protein